MDKSLKFFKKKSELELESTLMAWNLKSKKKLLWNLKKSSFALICGLNKWNLLW
jgi:hypothetical protein